MPRTLRKVFGRWWVGGWWWWWLTVNLVFYFGPKLWFWTWTKLNKKYAVKIFLNWGNKTQAYDFHVKGFLIYHINGNTLYKKKYLEISPSKGQIGLRKRNILSTNSIPFCNLHRLSRRWFSVFTN